MYRKRLKNVYELLETGNNKKVIQEVDKLLGQSNASATSKTKKTLNENEKGIAGYDEQTTMTIAKSLKCLALLRNGKRNESDKLLDELLESNTTDENALNIIMQYCKETYQLSKIVAFYENAVQQYQKTPNLIGTQEYEEMLTTLFLAYVRNRDFSKQQQIALKLYKQTNKMMFCFWNAASYVMMSRPDLNIDHLAYQQRSTDPKEKQKNEMYLQLAEKILQKAYEDQKMEYNGEYLLYLNILEERNKFEEALKIVDAFDEKENQSKLGIIDFKTKKKQIYFKQLKRWNDLFELSKTFLSAESRANIDDWITYETLFDSLIELLKENTEKNDKIKDTLQFLNYLIEKSECKYQGPYMGRIEFLNRLIQLNNQEILITNQINENLLKQYLNEYIKLFGLKPGFYYELVFFKDIINKFNLIDYVLEVLKELHDKNRPFTNIKSIYTCLSYWQMHSYFGKQDKMTERELIDLANQFEKMYFEALEFGKDLLSTGFQYADEFIIMAVHIRYNLYKKYNNSKYNLLELICTLKQALVNSPSNYQLKLLLLNLYSHLGVYEPLKKMYDSMEIKNIQHYSTSNLLMIHNLRLGSIQSSVHTYATMNQFFTSNLFDIVNYLANSYKFGTFLKSIEICSFLKTIRQSLSLNLCLTNNVISSFIVQSTHLVNNPNPVEASSANLTEDEIILNEFKLLKSKTEQHLKELANCSIVFDPDTWLLPNENTKLSEILLDHNDKEVLYHWDTSEEQIIGNRQYNLMVDEQRRLFKLRNLFVRYVDSCLSNWLGLQTLTSPNLNSFKKSLLDFDYEFNYELNDEKQSNAASVSNDKMSDNLAEETLDSKLKIYVTKSFYLKRWTQLNLNQLVEIFVSMTSDLCNQTEQYLAKQQQNNQSDLASYRDRFKNVCDIIMKKFDTIMQLFKDEASFKIDGLNRILECFSSCLELISFIIIIFTACLSNKDVKPIWSEKFKKSKKKKGLYAQYGESIDILFEIYEQLCLLVNYLNNQLKQIVSGQNNILTLCERFINKSTTQTANSKDLSDIPQAYFKSFEELRKLFNAKLNHLVKFTGNSILVQLDSLETLKI